MLVPITSLQNQKVKNLVKLRQRRQRDQQKLMLIDGYRALMLALNNNLEIDSIYFEESLADKKTTLLNKASQKGIKLHPVSVAVFQKIGYGHNPDGWLGLAPQPSFSLEHLPLFENPIYIVLEGLEKPGNLGAVLRSADAAGVTGLIVCNSQTDIYNPNVIRASRGAFFTVSLAWAGVMETIDWLQKNGIQILASTPTTTQVYSDVDMRSPTAIVLGAEHSGLTDVWLKHTLISIPMFGQVDSLNVAQAASILIYEAIRQRS